MTVNKRNMFMLVSDIRKPSVSVLLQIDRQRDKKSEVRRMWERFTVARVLPDRRPSPVTRFLCVCTFVTQFLNFIIRRVCIHP